MKEYQSNEEFFSAVKDLASKLENTGHKEAASELLKGIRMLNGLTDGWADFMNALDEIVKQYSKELNDVDIQTLKNFHSVAKKAVYRS